MARAGHEPDNPKHCAGFHERSAFFSSRLEPGILRLGSMGKPLRNKSYVAVIGAGAFGGWTALRLVETGAPVTLMDAWGPGNSRSSSGGETRVMRGTYGPNQPYTALAARSLRLWTSNERKWKRHLLHRIGVLWMVAGNDEAWESGSLSLLQEAKIPHTRLSR